MGQFYLLHSEYVPDSQTFLALWNAAQPVPGPVLSDQSACVANAYPVGYRGYPSVLYVDSKGGKHVKYNPATVAEVTEWAAGIEAAFLPPTLADAKAAKQAEITSGAQAAMAPLAAQYGTLEMQTWDQQAAEATAYTANNAAPTPLLSAIAQARGMDVATLAAHVLANKAAWVAISGGIVGQRLAFQDKLDAAQDLAAVAAIVVTYTLPSA